MSIEKQRPTFTVHQLGVVVEAVLLPTPKVSDPVARIHDDFPGLLPYPSDSAVDLLIDRIEEFAQDTRCDELLSKGPFPPKHELEQSKPANRNKVRKSVVLLRTNGSFAPQYPANSHVYIAYHKPPGVLCSRASDAYNPTDTRKRKKKVFLYDMLPDNVPAVPHIGRLDKDTQGLLLLTDDGSLHEPLLNKQYASDLGLGEQSKASKVYFVDVRAGSKMAHNNDGEINLDEVVKSMREPLAYERKDHSKLTKEPEVLFVSDPATVSVMNSDDDNELFQEFPLAQGSQMRLRVEIEEGRNRQVRRLCARAGLIVVRLLRYQFGPVSLSGLRLGEARDLSVEEVNQLYLKYAVGLGSSSVPLRLVVCGY